VAVPWFFYYSSDAVPTTLAASLGSVASGATGTVQVASITGNPVRFPFTLVAEANTVNAEVITVTQAATGTGPFTYSNSVRGDDGSGAPAHSSGAAIAHGIAARDMYKTDWINVLAEAWGADPTGVNDSTAAINNALLAANPGQPVYLPAGTYKTTAPINMPPGSVLMGDHANEVATDQIFGTTIQPSSAWAATTAGLNTWYGVICPLGEDVPSPNWSTAAEEQKIFGIHVDCSNVPGTTLCDGVQVFGGVSRPRFQYVLVSYATGNGFNFLNDSNGNGPDAVHMFRCNALNTSLAGFAHPKISDSTYIDCLAENCGRTSPGYDGWTITNASNSVLIGCRAEHNGYQGTGNGFTILETSQATGSGGCKLVGCSTDRNEGNGIQVYSNNNAATPVVLSGCDFRRDGRNNNTGGGGLAGIYVTAYPSSLQVSGCTVFPGIDDNSTGTTSPYYGMLLASNNSSKTYVQVGGGTYIQGFNTAISDDGSTAETVYDLSVLAATGSTNAQAVQGPRTGRATLTLGVATVSCTSVQSASNIILTPATVGVHSGGLGVSALNTGSSFVVSSTGTLDGNQFSWMILNP
jgi:hypothetical protein